MVSARIPGRDGVSKPASLSWPPTFSRRTSLLRVRDTGIVNYIPPRRTDFLMIVVFDIGNVLVRWDRRYLYRKVFDDEERMERFLATALGMDFVSHTDVAKDFAAAVAIRATKAFLNSPRKSICSTNAGLKRLANRSRRTSRAAPIARVRQADLCA